MGRVEVHPGLATSDIVLSALSRLCACCRASGRRRPWECPCRAHPLACGLHPGDDSSVTHGLAGCCSGLASIGPRHLLGCTTLALEERMSDLHEQLAKIRTWEGRSQRCDLTPPGLMVKGQDKCVGPGPSGPNQVLHVTNALNLAYW